MIKMKYLKCLLLILSVNILAINSVYALESTNINSNVGTIGGEITGTGEDEFDGGFNSHIKTSDDANDCRGILVKKNGDLNSFGLFLQTIFNLIKVLALVLFILLSTKDLALLITKNEIDTKKTLNVILKRGGISILIFLLPFILDILLHLFGLYNLSSCGIS